LFNNGLSVSNKDYNNRPTVVKAPEFPHITSILRSLHGSRLTNIINASHSPTKFSQPANTIAYTTRPVLSLL